MNPLSGVLGEAWGMYRTYAKHLLAIAFVIYVIAAIVAAVLSLAGTIGALLGSLVSIIAAYLLQATLVKAVQDVRDGRVDMSIGETVQAARPYLWSVVGASILAGIAITIGFILIIVPGLYLITIWAVIVPAIVIEGSGAMASFGRSRQLVRGHGWHVFGTLVLVYIILLVVGFVLGAIFSALPHVLHRLDQCRLQQVGREDAHQGPEQGAESAGQRQDRGDNGGDHIDDKGDREKVLGVGLVHPPRFAKNA